MKCMFITVEFCFRNGVSGVALAKQRSSVHYTGICSIVGVKRDGVEG